MALSKAQKIKLVKTFGLSVIEAKRLSKTMVVCPLCLKIPEYIFVLDHDRHTGRFRGLLCHPCNTRLGHLERGSIYKPSRVIWDSRLTSTEYDKWKVRAKEYLKSNYQHRE